jgi:diguanylate cyclase (GGDEF)-like protein
MTAPGRPRLLVVDDQAVNIRVMYEIFGSDHEVLMAAGGVEALEICRAQVPDLVLLDVSMPDLDGFEVCRRLKADPALQDIPVIFVTAANTPEEESRGFAVGAVDFIAKPVNPVVVRARVRTHLTLKSQSDLLRNLAYVDGLTGIANRRRFENALAGEWRICARSGEGLAVGIIDVDHFKLFNDRYGHQAGDDALRRVAVAIRDALRRPRDLVARYGGEEFACIVPDIEPDLALPLFENLRERVADLRIPHELSPTLPFVTISVGFQFASSVSASKPHDLIEAADGWLYKAKQQGRNRCAGSASFVRRRSA